MQVSKDTIIKPEFYHDTKGKDELTLSHLFLSDNSNSNYNYSFSASDHACSSSASDKITELVKKRKEVENPQENSRKKTEKERTNKKIKSDLPQEIKMVDLKELLFDFEMMKIERSNLTSIHQLQDYLTFRQKEKKSENDFWELWVEIPLKTYQNQKELLYLNVVILEDEYKSQTFSQTSYERLEPDNHGKKYTYIEVYENESLENPLLMIRVDSKCQIGELLYLSKGEIMTGNEVFDFFNQITDFLNLEKIYLHDDAKITLKVGQESTEILLRMYNILWDNGETWYGRNGFYPFNCHDLTPAMGDSGFSQNTILYYQAVQQLLETSIYQLYNELKKNKKIRQANLLRNFFEKSASDRSFEQITFSELAKILYQEHRQGSSNSPQSNFKTKNFILFYKNFLDCSSKNKFLISIDDTSPFFEQFASNLSTIWNHSFWLKDQIGISYKAFQETFGSLPV